MQWILALLAFASGCSLEVELGSGRYHCDDGVCPPGFACSSARVCEQPGDDGGSGSDAPPALADATPGASDATPAADANRCGNGTVDLGEECDDGNLTDTDGCRADCSWARCGDGTTRQGVEECDDGNTSSLDACSSSCQLCTGVTIDATGHCYDWGGIVEPWFAGSFTCATKDGYLASVTSSTERLFLAGEAPGFPYWVGLNDLQTEATYVWFNGEPQAPAEIPWDTNQPNGGFDNNDCIWAQSPDGELNDLGCAAGTSASPLCEIEGWKVRASDRHAYRFVHVQDDAAGHDAACAARGAHLATVDSVGERAFVAGLGAGSYWVGPFQPGNCRLATLGPGSFTSSTASCSQLAFALCEID